MFSVSGFNFTLQQRSLGFSCKMYFREWENTFYFIEFATVTHWARWRGMKIDINPFITHTTHERSYHWDQRGLHPLLFTNRQCGFFYASQELEQWKNCETGFSSLPKKTRMTNHLQMSQRRQKILLRYFMTLSFGPAGIWTCDLPLGRSALIHLS